MTSAALRQCLMDLDVVGMRALSRAAFPHLPQPATDADALASMHMARTQMQIIPPRQRYFSHCWLTERGLPSQLPDRLRPSAERMYPRVMDSVGVAVRSNFPEVKMAITGAMNYAVQDCYANGDKAPEIVKPRMMEARAKERRGLMLPRLVA